jgi:hypothetical protein
MLEAGTPPIVERNESESETDATGYLMEGSGFSAFVLDDGRRRFPARSAGHSG